MSPLTKLFVVLQVVLSLLLTAGIVVFVNRTNDFQASLLTAQQSLTESNARATAAEADAATAQATAEASVTAANSQIKDIQGQLASAQQQVADRDAQIAQATSSAALAAADQARLTDALKASENQKGKQSTVVASLRTDSDSLNKRNSDLNLSVADLTNRLEVANRERNNFQEQLAEANTQSQNYIKIIKDLGGNPNGVGGVAANLGAPAINGVVRATNNINGIPYATISVGSSDNVVKGMTFNVIDRNKGQFLGQLTIDSVQPNEATGHLQGPRISQVHAGTEVKTQL